MQVEFGSLIGPCLTEDFGASYGRERGGLEMMVGPTVVVLVIANVIVPTRGMLVDAAQLLYYARVLCRHVPLYVCILVRILAVSSNTTRMFV